jgi:DNA-binding MarR family transcriptional regulator
VARRPTNDQQTDALTEASRYDDEDSRPWLGLLLLAITNRFMHPIHVAVEEQHGLTRDDVAVLVCLTKTSATTAQEVVRYTARPKNSISRAVAALESKGLVRRTAHPHDGRASTISTTARGRQCCETLYTSFHQGDVNMTESLTDDERDHFTQLVNKIARSYMTRT